MMGTDQQTSGDSEHGLAHPVGRGQPVFPVCRPDDPPIVVNGHALPIDSDEAQATVAQWRRRRAIVALAHAERAALVLNHHSSRRAVERLLPATEAHATDAETLADEVADDQNATADERRSRRTHADQVQADITFAIGALARAKWIEP
jgi:hypothetical protein